MNKFCDKCGTARESSGKFCSECGTELPKDNRKLYLGLALIPMIGIAAYFAQFTSDYSADTETTASTASSSSTRSSSSSSSSSSSTLRYTPPVNTCKSYVTFSFDGPGADNNPSIQMSGPSGTYQDSNSYNSVSFSATSCVEGRYTFSYTNDARWVNAGQADVRTYSGSFYIDGEGSYCNVSISDGFSTSVYVSC